MKIAVTSTGNSFDSKIDSRFGRCSYFAVYDTYDKSIEFVPNYSKENVEGAGPASVQLIASRGVNKVVSGEFGSKVKSLLDSLKIQQIVMDDPQKTVQQVIDFLYLK
jgi:predicted Fe-Mo cluster-binding NifX family protein